MLRIESNNNASLTLKNTNANAGGGEYQLFTSSSTSNPALGAGSLAIYYDHPSAAAYRFSINTAGNVGIGTGMPTEKLDVAGNVKASGTIKAGTITYPNTAGTSGYYLKTDGTGTASWAAISGAGVPYTGATGPVNLGAYDLTVQTVNGLTLGNGSGTHNTIVGGAGVNRTFTSVLSNTAIGYNTLSSSTPGSSNTVVGAWALVSNTGAENSALGVGALERNLAGRDNTAIGYYSLRNNLTGSKNTALGHNSLTSGTPGEKNTMIGAEANVSGDFTNATALGYGAIVSASNTIQLGADGNSFTNILNESVPTIAITNVKTSGTLTAGTVTYPNTHRSTAGDILTINSSGTASWAAASSSSGVPYSGASQAVNLGGYDLTVNGMTIGTGKVAGAGTLNTIVGEYALNRANTFRGTDNTAIGHKSMGNETASATSAGTKNTAVGSWTLVGNSGTENSALGVGALQQNQGGNYNTAMGNMALNINLSGSNNTALGYAADVSANNLSNATAIGNGAKVAASNTIQLGNTDVTDVKTSGTITAAGLAVTGNVTSTTGSISGFDAALNNQTGTTYTLTSADNGKVVTLNNASAITLTINTGLGDGFNCLIVQKGVGQITIAGTATRINRQSHTKTAGQYAVVSIVNIGSDNVIIAGDTGS
jgi:hypothetical protein